MTLAKSALAVILSAAVALPLAAPAFAANGEVIDRVENRADRRENRRDEAVDTGVWDVVEDHLDRAEDRRDYRDQKAPKVIVVPQG
ncbi:MULTISPECIES: hypothetical protein [Leisingera]|uniref:hypothetical protein n=1 Tax=Leisingera TaxID=191028 RepID=UPI0002DEFBB0|nr:MULTISPECIES: hypothetical protein [Leisingera]KIC16618.1 hypothetical protein RA21_13405 [Leisingera sp. ANG-DT]KIC24776.1 hypothetical protein RA23_09540 [Leisingera sp. ANG-S3]KIC28444.1 hypothetical protein RA24_11020 [Leisingera sp. ANG-M6]KIC31573.1 hypothetical protein RA25_15780 [Leisingera sp. ANG-S5]KIC55368.1 hypothetical protein RA22_01070 [Leisingera sp. ANG-S]